MPAPHRKKAASDNFALYTVAGVVLALAIGFIATWLYVRAVENAPTTAFLDSGPLVVSTDGYIIATRLAFQTSADDAKWAAKHRKTLIGVMESTLSISNPKQLRTPTGLQALQGALTAASNTALKTAKIQSVLLTEFLIKSENY